MIHARPSYLLGNKKTLCGLNLSQKRDEWNHLMAESFPFEKSPSVIVLEPVSEYDMCATCTNCRKIINGEQ